MGGDSVNILGSFVSSANVGAVGNGEGVAAVSKMSFWSGDSGNWRLPNSFFSLLRKGLLPHCMLKLRSIGSKEEFFY